MPEWMLEAGWNGRGGWVWIDHGIVELVHLNDSIDQESDVVEADSDDLNSVVETERIPYEEDLVQESKDEE